MEFIQAKDKKQNIIYKSSATLAAKSSHKFDFKFTIINVGTHYDCRIIITTENETTKRSITNCKTLFEAQMMCDLYFNYFGNYFDYIYQRLLDDVPDIDKSELDKLFMEQDLI